MNGTRLLLDTNILITDIVGNHPEVHPIIEDNDIYISIITKIELLGYHGISEKEEKIIREFLDMIHIIPLHETISDIAIELRRKYKMKTPDSIIAASAISLNIPLLTEDKDFQNVTG